MAGFREFLTGEVLTAANVNNFLMKQSVMVFADAAARTSALGAEVVEGMLTYNEDTAQLEVYDGAAFVLAAPAPPAGIGSNVVQTVKTDTFSTASVTFTTITGLTATITPTSATSKILVTANINMSMNDGGSASFVRVAGGNAGTFVGDNASLVRCAAFSGHRLGDRFGIEAQAYQQIVNYLDAPATTSPVTYSLEMSVGSSTGHVNRNGLNNRGSVPSSITLIEVAA